MLYSLQKILLFFTLFRTIFCSHYNLSIIHFNDFHARYEPVNNISTTCESDSCIGGFSRLYSTIMQLKKENSDSILLNAGDNFKGTLWYMVHRWNVTQHFLNKLPLDAITLGNHEFDDGIDGLVPFLMNIHAPVVVSNIDSTLEPRLQKMYRKSVIIERNNRKIGIIGAITTDTKLTSSAENLVFKDQIESIDSEAQKLEQDGVFTNIVLSHCGYEADLEIARKASPKITVVVGGHTDTFLYSGSPVPGPDKPSGPYPTVVTNENGNKVLVVQASAYTKYLGNITVDYDEFGNVTGWNGTPIFLANELDSDKNMDAELAEWKRVVDLAGDRVIGQTTSIMWNKPCRSEECSLGNFATDAMLFHYENKKINLCNSSVAFIHAGGMRVGIEAGNVTFKQLVTTFPFQDTINRCDIKGKYIKEILESSVNDVHLQFPHLFQVSGLQVVFNVSKPEGQRIQSLKICRRDVYNTSCGNFEPESDYNILLPSFLTNSGFNPLFKKYLRNKTTGDKDSDIYIEYLKNKSPLDQKVDGRIKIIQ